MARLPHIRTRIGHVVCVFLLLLLRPSFAESPPIAPSELVREVVRNETDTSSDTSKYMFLDRRQNLRNSQTKLMVETRDAMAGMIVANDDHPLSAADRQAELARVRRFVNDPEELRRKQRQERDTADRINRIVKALPDAFLYDYAGTETGRTGVGNPGDELVRLKFRPNPKYQSPSRVEQVLSGMQGIILIDAQKKRIAQIDGNLVKEVSFGWGILGHLDPGGHFLVEQGDVGDDHWEITRMHLNFTGKVLLFKSISMQIIETFSDFRRVPAGLTFAQGVELLEKEQEKWAGNSQQAGNQRAQ